jgi:hypothetical protein
MTNRRIVGLIVAWAISLVGVGVWAQGGQGQGQVALPFRVVPNPPIGGQDIRFQPKDRKPVNGGKALVGRFQVRDGDTWYDVVLEPAVK